MSTQAGHSNTTGHTSTHNTNTSHVSNYNNSYQQPQQQMSNPNNYIDQQETNTLWELDFEILRFFRKSFNNAVDFDSSPRDIFDAEYLLSLRMRLLKRNFKIIIVKFLFMSLLLASTFFLHTDMVMIFAFIYTISFTYYLLVPIGFSKFVRQYVMDDSKDGKLNKFHNTYKKWIKPLEFIAMNLFTIVFLILGGLLYLKLDLVYIAIQEFVDKKIILLNIVNYLQSITYFEMQNSLIIIISTFAITYLIFFVVIYKILAPKWEKKREENLKQYTNSGNTVARNLIDEFGAK